MKKMKPENDVILSALKLSRAMRRCPPPPMETPFPPAVGRLLECIAANPQVSSRDLCEMLDLRPSSLSEMLTRAEKEGWIVRTVDEEDRRVVRVALSAKGSEMVSRMETVRKEDFNRKTACFTEEEKAQFCALCNKLSEHIESLASDVPEEFRRPPFPRPPHGGWPHGGPGRPHGDRPDAERPDPDRPDADHPDENRPRFPFPPEGRMRC